jgi:hypothetical protein
MPKFERITLIIESLPGARAQVHVNIPTPMPGRRLETPAHTLAIDALGWLGKQPAVAGFVYGGLPHMPPRCLHQIAEPATQEPFMWAIQGPDGSAYMDEGCVSSVREDVQAEVDGLNSGLDADDDPYQVVPVYLAAAPQAVQAAVPASITAKPGQFNTGDTIVCVNTDGATYITKDKEYVAGVMGRNPGGVFIKSDDGEEAEYRADRFVIAATQPAAQGMEALTSAARDVLAERKRQIETEGWKPERDDVYDTGEMALAAACYAAHSASCAAIKAPHTAQGVFVRTRSAQDFVGEMWPWSADWWKPSGHRRNLEKAAALILAEIERIDRAALAAQAKQGGAA